MLFAYGVSISLFKKKPPQTAAITRFEVESEAYQAYMMLGKEAAAGRIPIVHMALVSKGVAVRTVDVFDRKKSQMEDEWAYAPLGVDRKRLADDRAIGYQMTVKDCYRFVSESGMHVIAILEETDPSQYDRFVGRWGSETRRYPVVEKRPKLSSPGFICSPGPVFIDELRVLSFFDDGVHVDGGGEACVVLDVL